MPDRETVDSNELACAQDQLAKAEERAGRLALELEAAHRRIADLQDFDYSGNTDPVIERLGILKARLGRTAIGARLAPLYRKITHQ